MWSRKGMPELFSATALPSRLIFTLTFVSFVTLLTSPILPPAAPNNYQGQRRINTKTKTELISQTYWPWNVVIAGEPLLSHAWGTAGSIEVDGRWVEKKRTLRCGRCTGRRRRCERRMDELQMRDWEKLEWMRERWVIESSIRGGTWAGWAADSGGVWWCAVGWVWV